MSEGSGHEKVLGEALELFEGAMTDEDRAWLEGDFSRLGEYEPYELTEEQLAEERPIRFVPGMGLLVDDDGDPEEDGTR